MCPLFCLNGDSERTGVVHFVSGRVPEATTGSEIIKPRAERLYSPNSRLPSHEEEDVFERDSDSSISR
jgi:hypothetical protein